MSKYSPEFKHEVVQYYLSGQYGQQRTAEKFGIARALVRSWLSVYKKHGVTGLKSGGQFTGQFKCNVVEFMFHHQLPAKATADYFGLPFSYVSAWGKIYNNRGKEALFNSRLGRPPKMKKNIMPSKPDNEKTQAELLDEVEYLRTEVAYLKKLRALIQQQERTTAGLKHKPSKN